MSTPLKIAIVGAGPSGCTLARILVHELSSDLVDVTIFESEASANARSQGGTLDLHTDTGIAALRRAGLHDEFIKRCRFDGEAAVFADKYLRKFINMGGTKDAKASRGRPEIDRALLREMLVDSLPENMIRWNHRIRRVSEENDKYTLHFTNATGENESVTDFDLIVGADGAWSKIRPLVSAAQPFYSGVAMIRLTIPDVKNTHPDLYERVNRGSLFAYADGKMVSFQQIGDGTMSVSCAFRTSDSAWSVEELDFDAKDLTACKKYISDMFADWHPDLTAFFPAAADCVPWAAGLYMLPVDHHWTNRPGVTLMGDAAHVMTPFAGEGVNVALSDASTLATAISKTCTGPGGLPSAREDRRNKLSKHVAAYEAEMFGRAGKVQRQTEDMKNLVFADAGLQENVERWVLAALRGGLPLSWLTVPLVAPLVYAYFFVWRLLNPLPKNVEYENRAR